MKRNRLSNAGAALFVALTLSSGAHAEFISGTIDFTGPVTLDTVSLETATKVASFHWPRVATATGDFDAYVLTAAENQGVGDLVTIVSPWSFKTDAPGLSPFWTVNGFSFDLTSSMFSKEKDADGVWHLDVWGTGIAYGNGFDRTNGVWSFNMTDVGGSSHPAFSFQSTTHVPDGGMTLVLFGLSLLGIHGTRHILGRS
jgi:hypothetical protein